VRIREAEHAHPSSGLHSNSPSPSFNAILLISARKSKVGQLPFPNMDHQGPLDVETVKNLLGILHDNLNKRQTELHDLMVSSFQELSGVKSELSEQKPLLTSLAEQLLGLQTGIDAVIKSVGEVSQTLSFEALSLNLID
jgi:hypothetical protein